MIFTKTKNACWHISSIYLMALKQIIRTSFGEVAHDDEIESYNHTDNIEEQYCRRDGLMGEGI
jgi:hypothetical protein